MKRKIHTSFTASLPSFAVLLLALLLPLSMHAQKGKAKKHAPKAQKTVTFTEVQPLLDAYRFAEAEAELQRQLQDASQMDETTLLVKKAQLKEALKGMDMLSVAAKVTFIDSIVIHRNELNKVYTLSHDNGTLTFAPYTYTNSFGDLRLLHSDAQDDRMQKMLLSRKTAGEWSEPRMLSGTEMSDDATDIQGYPYLMPDGMTLYFSAISDNGLGGYDIYVTRYNRDTDSFLKPENIGMPFNSPANDYLYVIDETTQIGYFATDRHQDRDSVCVYVFIPTETREKIDADDSQAYISMAMLNSIADTQKDIAAVNEARMRLRSIKQTTNAAAAKHSMVFVINDDIAYTSLSCFKSTSARRIAGELQKKAAELQKVTDELEALRMRKDSNRKLMLKLEADARLLAQSVSTLSKNMRKAELGIR